jgi:hypothetical protein
VDELTVRSPATGPVRVRVGGGASTAVAGTRTLHDLAAGSTLTPKGWKNATDRYEVTAAAAIGSLDVQSAGG